MKQPTTTLPFLPTEQWVLSFSLAQVTSSKKQLLLQTTQQGKATTQFFVENNLLTIKLCTYEKDTPLFLNAVLETQHNDFKLVWRGYRVELWNNDILADEEWPIGECFHSAEANIEIFNDQVKNTSISSQVPLEADTSSILHHAQYWSPNQGIVNVGDCMPFYDGTRYHLYYLQDRNGHQSKWRLGAHQYAHISSDNLKDWVIHPMAIPITHQWEGSICTGSILQANDLYYAFYAVRMSDGTSAKISWATSTDAIHFTKSEVYFSLHFPYESTSVRDPEVFWGEDSQYHMLLTTSWLGSQPNRNDCLAHLVSTDLETWTELPPFLVPGYTDQPECCNYFKWNDWYYLIFSNYGTAKYRYSKNPFESWQKPQNEIIGSCLYRVPKTAEFTNNRRILAGFLPNAPDGGSYAGNVIFSELVQYSDGTLGTKFVPEMFTVGTKQLQVSLPKDEVFSYQQTHLMTTTDCISFTAQISPENEETSYGFSLEFDSDISFEIRVEPFNQKVTVSPLHSNPLLEHANFSLYQVTLLHPTAKLQLRFEHGILNLCVNDARTLVCRLAGAETAQSCQIGCFSKDGACSFDTNY